MLPTYGNKTKTKKKMHTKKIKRKPLMMLGGAGKGGRSRFVAVIYRQRI
jgi:hypothetical protein